MSDRSIDLSDGRKIPIIGFGTWQIQGAEAYRSVRAALEVGYRHIDTATVYGNENEIGRAIADSRISREEIFITTKIPPDRRKDVGVILTASLRALRCEYVDLWLIHWPPDRGSALSMWQTMITAQSAGKARSLGVSNFDEAQIDELIDGSDTVPALNQIRWSPFLYESAVVQPLKSRGIVLEGYSPFKASRLRDPVIGAIAQRHQVTPAQVVLCWHLEHDFALDGDELSNLDSLASR